LGRRTRVREFPLTLGKNVVEYLKELKDKLQIAHEYADEHTKEAQSQYVNRYNLRSKDKSFVECEKCLILTPDNTASKVFSRWKPAEIVSVISPNSYLTDCNGSRSHLHANKIRKFPCSCP